MRAFSFLAAVALCAAVAAAQSASSTPRDGQQMTFSGRLVMQPVGRLQFVTVKKVGVDTLAPQGEHDAGGAQALGEIALSGYADYALLYQHRGQPVTVTGRVARDTSSPFYWHGVSLLVSSVRLEDGEDLAHAQSAAPQPIAVDTGSYRASVTLPDDLSAPWLYSMAGQPAQKGRFLSCSSNGGGDVVNCDCANGFHAQEVLSERRGRNHPGGIVMNGTAQVAAGDLPEALEITVTCAR